MGVTNSNKVINTDQIACDGSLRVTLALTAAPDIRLPPHRYCAGTGPLRQYDRYPAIQHEAGRQNLHRRH